MGIPQWISTFPFVQYTLSYLQDWAARVLATGPVPEHVAFVMDGNRRFAKQNNLEVQEGHSAGFESMAQLLELCYQVGVKVVTIYAFSIENFKRPKYEVDALMDLAKIKLLQVCQHGDLAERHGIRINVLGERKLIRKDVIEVIDKATELTKDNSSAVLNVCFPYTSRDDIVQAMQSVVSEYQKNDLDPDSIDEPILESHMFTKDCPPLHILIRTSGVSRLSDFMLWQCNDNTSIEFVDTLWPDFNVWNLFFILLKWSLRTSTRLKNSILQGNDSDDEIYDKKFK